jgi:hypothetical protein
MVIRRALKEAGFMGIRVGRCFVEWLQNLVIAIVLALAGYLLWRWTDSDGNGDES